MEANTFIKSVEVEGNKIKNIQFYGDWDLSPLTEKSDNIVAMLR